MKSNSLYEKIHKNTKEKLDMKKFIITILTVITALSLFGCAEEESSPVDTRRVYSVTLKDNTVLDAENSYFLIEVNNAEEIPDTVLTQEEGETNEEYEYRYNKAVAEAYAKGTYILVEGLGLDKETVVLNKDNGTITGIDNKTLVLVKKEEAVDNQQAVYQIQILLDAKTAVNARSVAVTVGNQRFLFNNFNISPARIWKNENGDTITSIYVPDNVTNDKGGITKKGINVISEPVNIPVYSYDSTNKVAVGPFYANTDISGLVTSETITPFAVEDYAVSENLEAGITAFPGCIANGQSTCGLTIFGYQTLSTEKNLELPITTTFNTGAETTTALSVTSKPSLLIKGTKPVEYDIHSLTSMYLEATDSAAIFDVKAVNGNTISQTDIQVTGKYNGTADFTDGSSSNNGSIATGTYIIKEITQNSHYRIFMLAGEAANAAANGGLIITVKDEANTYTANDVMTGKISYGYIAGNKLTNNYKLKVNSAASIDIKLNYFGATPTLYKYNSSGNTADLYTTSQTFSPVLSTVNQGTAIQVSNGTCSTSAAAVDCTLTVTATQEITSANASTNGTVTLSYTDGDSSSETVTLPSTQLIFYTTEAETSTTTTTVSSD